MPTEVFAASQERLPDSTALHKGHRDKGETKLADSLCTASR